MNRETALVALIHDQLGQILTKVLTQDAGANPFQIHLGEKDTLVGQLATPGDGPPRVSCAFALDIVTSSVSTLLDALPTPASGPFAALKGSDFSELLDKVRNALGGQLGLFDRQRDAIATLIATRNPTGLRDAADGLFRGILEAFRGQGGGDGSALAAVQRLQQFLGNDIGTVLPLATILGAAQRGLQNAAGIPESVERGLLDYFFSAAGYRTVDGESVVAPVHLSDIGRAAAGAGSGADAGGPQLGGLFSKTTAERYLRDVTRVIVESAFDAGRGLNGPQGRYNAIAADMRKLKSTKKEQDAIVKKFVAWFRGFSSMAESTSMRAVEIGTQGVSEFQTNPLIAAAAGSFAGTVARKLAQDSFLAVLRTELDSALKK